jgi:hypothetical protein
MLRTSMVALAVLALSAGGAGAATGSFKIGTAAGTTEADCTNAGGTVVTDAQGNKICRISKASTSGSAPAGREPSN